MPAWCLKGIRKRVVPMGVPASSVMNRAIVMKSMGRLRSRVKVYGYPNPAVCSRIPVGDRKSRSFTFNHPGTSAILSKTIEMSKSRKPISACDVRIMAGGNMSHLIESTNDLIGSSKHLMAEMDEAPTDSSPMAREAGDGVPLVMTVESEPPAVESQTSGTEHVFATAAAMASYEKHPTYNTLPSHTQWYPMRAFFEECKDMRGACWVDTEPAEYSVSGDQGQTTCLLHTNLVLGQPT